jgi:hypothetical protein
VVVVVNSTYGDNLYLRSALGFVITTPFAYHLTSSTNSSGTYYIRASKCVGAMRLAPDNPGINH